MKEAVSTRRKTIGYEKIPRNDRDFIELAPGATLVSVRFLSAAWGLSPSGTSELLENLHVPTLDFKEYRRCTEGDQRYVLHASLVLTILSALLPTTAYFKAATTDPAALASLLSTLAAVYGGQEKEDLRRHLHFVGSRLLNSACEISKRPVQRQKHGAERFLVDTPPSEIIE